LLLISDKRETFFSLHLLYLDYVSETVIIADTVLIAHGAETIVTLFVHKDNSHD